MEQTSLIELGREIVHDLDLKRLRERFGISRTTQAHMIGVSPTALREWESGVSLSRTSAQRIGAWYQTFREYVQTIDPKVAEALTNGELVHVTIASQQLAMSWGTITEKCQAGALRCISLGPLGTYVYRSGLPE